MDLAVAALRLLPPETAHRTTVRLAEAAAPFLPGPHRDDPRLAVTAFGLSFPNPVGIAAGFDKNARAYPAMLKFGFGFAECGTVTPRPQAGNPRPRLFRLTEDGAIVNRMGFDNDGMEAIAERLSRPRRGIVGINIGANKDSPDRIADYGACFARLAPLADYVAVNVSSPNTPGLRDLQARAALEMLLSSLVAARGTRKIPLLVKIAPDLDEVGLDDVAEAALVTGIDGIIVTNTTLARPPWLKSAHAAESGGLSGKPLFASSTRILSEVHARVGSKLVLVGVGGITSGEDAYSKIRAGASLVQLYSALVYQGTGLVGRIKRGLLACLQRDGFARLSDAIGASRN